MKQTASSRRAYRRRAIQLEVKIIFRPPASFTSVGDAGRLTLVGRTRDISETGMALIVSARNIDRYLNAKENAFDVELRLPDGPVSFEVTPVYFRKTPVGGSASYVIGSRFTKAGQQHHARLINFIRSLPVSQTVKEK
jgi:c-di-GMP-binding flagellar brake protein YcgR